MRWAYLAKTTEYDKRNKHRKWGLDLGLRAPATMVDMIGMSFIPMNKVIGPFLYFVPVLLIVWGGFGLLVAVGLRDAIFPKY